VTRCGRVACRHDHLDPPGQLGISGNFEGDFFVGFADGCVWFIRNTVPFEELSKFFTVSGAAEFAREGRGATRSSAILRTANKIEQEN
jgi:hypothetical protein